MRAGLKPLIYTNRLIQKLVAPDPVLQTKSREKNLRKLLRPNVTIV